MNDSSPLESEKDAKAGLEKNVPEISVILPLFNEQGNVEPLVLEIKQALEPLQRPFEIICIDDGSSDGSKETILALQEKDKRIVALSHYRNFGQSAALATGFFRSRGSVVVTLDGDGQNDPADIPRLLELLGNYDCVCGIRQKRRDKWIRRIASKIANRIRDWLTGDHIQDSGCTLRAFYKECLLEIPIFNGMHRFFPTLLRLKGRKVKEIPVAHRPRIWGQSKYGIMDRAFRGFLDCLAIRWWKMRCFPQKRCLDQ